MFITVIEKSGIQLEPNKST